MFKFKLALPVVLFVVLLVAIPNVQASPSVPTWMAQYEPMRQGLPPAIGGYKVFAVLTPDNTACMLTGEKRLVLQVTQPNVEEFLRTNNYASVRSDLEQKGLGEYAKWGIQFAGPGTVLEEFLTENQKWTELRRKFGCVKAKPVSAPAFDGSDWQEFKEVGPGLAIYEDTDAGRFTDDNAQSVNLLAPNAIANRPQAVLFLNNVKTDSSTFYMLQNGLEFWNGIGRVVWTDTSWGYSDQPYNIAYIPAHHYWFSITFTNGIWWMCAMEYQQPQTYQCRSETRGVGTTLGYDSDTSVWVENQNTDPNWYQGFDTYLFAYYATIYRNGIGQYWATQHHHTSDHCSSNWPPANALGGSLLNGGAGFFRLSGVPVNCP